MSLTNESILQQQSLDKRSRMNEYIANMRTKYPKFADWTDDEIEAVYNDSNSHSQSGRCLGGGSLERYIEMQFEASGISFRRQVPINKDGIVVDSKKDAKVIDIVFGEPVVGDHISNYKVMSLKKSSRERHSEDDWTFVHQPKLFLYATLESDYPSPEKFQESETRKLVCAKTKKKDSRKFKLGFEDIIAAVRE